MFDRMSVWVGAGVMTAGMSASLLLGSGVALAGPDPAGGGATSSADSAMSGTSQPAPEKKPSATTTGADSDGAEGDQPAKYSDPNTEKPDGTDISDDPPSSDVTDDESDPGTQVEEPAVDSVAPTHSRKFVFPRRHAAKTVDTDSPTATPEPAVDLSEPVDVSAPAEPAAHPETELAAQPKLESAQTADVSGPSVARAHLALVAATDDTSPAQAAVPRRQTLLSAIGTLFFNLYGVAIQVLGGPPRLPPNSTATVHSSSLHIDCGDGYDVPADWYVPDGPTPTTLIYLQHGFFAAAPFYSYTATRLADATHSIVVATSLTSNFLACDGCWLGGSPMHKAVANLFSDSNTALADSATAAGYSSSLLNGVTKIALIGHSAGGGLVAGTAGYMAENGTIGKLAGVVMLDGVGFGPVVPDALSKVPDTLPIYDLSGRSYFWNLSGKSNIELEQARPGEFYGVRLVKGLHSDSMVGGNLFVQVALYLVTGFSKPYNVDAAEILSAAWINDMFAGVAPVAGPLPDSPYYGTPGELLDIDTPRGTAHAYVSPGPPEHLTLIDKLFTWGAHILFGIDFAKCVAPDTDGPAEIASGSPLNTLLSLDGRTKPGQSIGQQCMNG